MTMQLVDWGIVFGCIVALTWFSLRTARYMQGVADFLAGNRSAGRYMLTMAASATGLADLRKFLIVDSFPPCGVCGISDLFGKSCCERVSFF